MDLKDINKAAEALLSLQKELSAAEEELETTIRDLRDLPRKAEKMARFAKLTGASADDDGPVAAAEKKQASLTEKRDRLLVETDEEESRLIDAVCSEQFTVPLSDTPKNNGDFWVFSFRGNAKYPAAIGFLSELMGVGRPIPIEGTLLDEAGVRVPIEFEMPVEEAMDKVVGAFEQVQNRLKLKQTSGVDSSDGW